METLCCLDLICRRVTGKSLPTELLVMIVKMSRRVKPKKVFPRDPEFIDKGSRVKRVKTKIRLKRAMRFR